MDLRSVVVVHQSLGRLTLEKAVRTTAATVVVQARCEAGQLHEVTLGRRRGRSEPGGLAAFSTRPSRGGAYSRRRLTRSVVDALVVARAERLGEDGGSYLVRSRGLGEWFDPALSIRRPVLVTEPVAGTSLATLEAESWREEAWQIVSSLIAMLMVTPSGERAPHRDVRAENVLLGPANELHLLDPGVELTRAAAERSGFDLADGPDDEPWDEEETVLVTSPSAYPTFPPGVPGADLQALGLMVFEGITGRKLFADGSPAPRSYNFGAGAHGRGVDSPKIVLGSVPKLGDAAGRVTRQMEAVVSKLLWAPYGHELTLGHGPSLRDWTALCHQAAESVR